MTQLTTNPAEDVFPMWSAHDGDVIFSVESRQPLGPLPPGSVRRRRASPHVVGRRSCSRATSRRMGACWCSSGRAPRPAGTSGWRIPTTCNRLRSWCRRQPTNATRSRRETGSGSRTINASGRHEIFMRSLSAAGTRMQVSTGGGSQVRWRADGRELFYIAADGRLMAAAVTPGEGAEAPKLAAPARSSPHRSAPGRRRGRRPVRRVARWPALSRQRLRPRRAADADPLDPELAAPTASGDANRSPPQRERRS